MIMKYMPKQYDLFNDMFDGFFKPVNMSNAMRTDVFEKDGYYHFDIELPGYAKEDVKMELVDGYLNIKASHTNSDEEKNAKGNLIRSERYFGSVSRSFYVGDNIKAEDVKAKYENGILQITVPSAETKRIETAQTISIE